MKKTWLLSAAFTLLFSTVLLSCSAQKHKKHRKKDADTPSTSIKTASNSSGGNCDTTVWKYVYNPGRLQVIEMCKTVTGVIEESSANKDGDQHMLIKLDKGQETLLTKRNIQKKQGDLVLEAVCANNVSQKKVGNTCSGYVNKIKIPAVGAHVKVTGSYVIDSHNGWAEIHPITKIELLPK